MTRHYKAIITVTVAVLSTSAIYQTHNGARLRAQVQSLQQQQALLEEQNRQLHTDAEKADRRATALRGGETLADSQTRELLRLRGEVTRLRADVSAAGGKKQAQDSSEETVRSWLDRVEMIKQKLQNSPGENIPEFQFMTEEAWVHASTLLRSGPESNDTNVIRFAQGCAKNEFANALYSSLKKYMAGHAGEFPSDLQQLAPYFEKLSDASVFQRYEIVRAQLVTIVDRGSRTAQQVYRAPDAASATGNPTPIEWVVAERTPLYTGDARVIVSSTGAHVQLW